MPKSIDDLFILSVSDDDDRYVYAIRAENKSKANTLMYQRLREQWPEEMRKPKKERNVYFTLTKFTLWADITCIA